MKKEKSTTKIADAHEVLGEMIGDTVGETTDIEHGQVMYESSSSSITSGIAPDVISDIASSIAPDQLMYVGPTLLNPIYVQHRAVYVGGIPVSAKKLVEKDIELAACFLPLSEAGKVLRELERDDAQSSDYARRFKVIQKRYTTVNKGE